MITTPVSKSLLVATLLAANASLMLLSQPQDAKPQTTVTNAATKVSILPKPKQTAKKATAKKDPRYIVVTTGTRIHQEVKRVGHTTDGIQTVHVVDVSGYERSGQARLGEFLRRFPNFR